MLPPVLLALHCLQLYHRHHSSVSGSSDLGDQLSLLEDPSALLQQCSELLQSASALRSLALPLDGELSALLGVRDEDSLRWQVQSLFNWTVARSHIDSWQSALVSSAQSLWLPSMLTPHPSDTQDLLLATYQSLSQSLSLPSALQVSPHSVHLTACSLLTICGTTLDASVQTVSNFVSYLHHHNHHTSNSVYDLAQRDLGHSHAAAQQLVWLRHAVSHHPYSAALWLSLAQRLVISNDHSSALRAADQALRLLQSSLPDSIGTMPPDFDQLLNSITEPSVRRCIDLLGVCHWVRGCAQLALRLPNSSQSLSVALTLRLICASHGTDASTSAALRIATLTHQITHFSTGTLSVQQVIDVASEHVLPVVNELLQSSPLLRFPLRCLLEHLNLLAIALADIPDSLNLCLLVTHLGISISTVNFAVASQDESPIIAALNHLHLQSQRLRLIQTHSSLLVQLQSQEAVQVAITSLDAFIEDLNSQHCTSQQLAHGSAECDNATLCTVAKALERPLKSTAIVLRGVLSAEHAPAHINQLYDLIQGDSDLLSQLDAPRLLKADAAVNEKRIYELLSACRTVMLKAVSSTPLMIAQLHRLGLTTTHRSIAADFYRIPMVSAQHALTQYTRSLDLARAARPATHVSTPPLPSLTLSLIPMQGSVDEQFAELRQTALRCRSLLLEGVELGHADSSASQRAHTLLLRWLDADRCQAADQLWLQNVLISPLTTSHQSAHSLARSLLHWFPHSSVAKFLFYVSLWHRTMQTALQSVLITGHRMDVSSVLSQIRSYLTPAFSAACDESSALPNFTGFDEIHADRATRFMDLFTLQLLFCELLIVQSSVESLAEAQALLSTLEPFTAAVSDVLHTRFQRCQVLLTASAISPAQAIILCRQFIEGASDHANHWLTLAQLHSSQLQIDAAIHVCTASAHLSPTLALMRALLLMRVHRWHDALQVFDTIPIERSTTATVAKALCQLAIGRRAANATGASAAQLLVHSFRHAHVPKDNDGSEQSAFQSLKLAVQQSVVPLAPTVESPVHVQPLHHHRFLSSVAQKPGDDRSCDLALLHIESQYRGAVQLAMTSNGVDRQRHRCAALHLNPTVPLPPEPLADRSQQHQVLGWTHTLERATHFDDKIPEPIYGDIDID